MHLTWLLAQADDNSGNTAGLIGGLGFACCFSVVWLGMMVLIIGGLWKIFTKAGQPGWAAIVPIYNIFILCTIAGKPAWWIVLFFIPFVNIVVSIMVWAEVAKRFGKDTGFVIGLILLPMVFLPLLGWGNAQYHEGGV